MSWELSVFKNDISNFNRLLIKYDVPIDYQSLYDLEGRLGSINDFCFSIENVIFEINECISGTVPNDVDTFKVTFDLEFHTDKSKNKLLEDPFPNEDGYSFQLLIEGGNSDNSEEYINCWHLDRHIEGGEATKTTHPFYHFQNGGDSLEELPIKGNALFTAAPRIPHPPMDIFLAFHFIVCNFYNRKTAAFVGKLFTDIEYLDIIERAKERLWKPYYEAFNDSNKHKDYTIENITPLYSSSAF